MKSVENDRSLGRAYTRDRPTTPLLPHEPSKETLGCGPGRDRRDFQGLPLFNHPLVGGATRRSAVSPTVTPGYGSQPGLAVGKKLRFPYSRAWSDHHDCPFSCDRDEVFFLQAPKHHDRVTGEAQCHFLSTIRKSRFRGGHCFVTPFPAQV